MKAVWFFPLAFVANVHGFILLVPYLVFMLTVVRTAQLYSPRNPMPECMPSGDPKPEIRNPKE